MSFVVVQSKPRPPIEMLWNDIKNMAVLHQFYNEEWSQISPEPHTHLIRSYRMHMFEVITAKGGLTSCYIHRFRVCSMKMHNIDQNCVLLT